MVTHGADLLRAGKFNHDIGISLLEIVAASIVSVLLGFVIGLVIHAFPRMRRALEPLLSSYYAVPTFIFYPVFIAVLGGRPLSISSIPGFRAVVAMITPTPAGLSRRARAR